jgi:hypothetical protein
VEESDTCGEGEHRAIKMLLLEIGKTRLGPPPQAVKAQLAEVTDVDHLLRMGRAAAWVASWQEIIETP